ncbi:hypothetical protein SETIT_9G482600v2 [Setaria italica]|uniref:Phytosulfokine n=3 Tax=Setaria TaxID=4554 RepID=A0A368STT8_SETIT|nr:phytosulfokines 2 [Setaria italica]RCV45804.1 hypothetical protein SETIT_9G482600v2 [Setaria italica]TKV97325.1 hypothetical protein SEVIR_9G486600v2 [Setaria viridis]
MASTSSKQLQAPTLLLVAVLLFLVCATRVQAARPEPRAKDHMPQAELAVSAATVVGDEKSCSGPGMEMHEAEPEAMECEGEEEGEECLMRRTLVAHTDYIYTQGKHN